MKKTTFLIAGKHAVAEALKNPKRKVVKVFLTEDSRKAINKNNQNLNLLKSIKLFFKTKNAFIIIFVPSRKIISQINCYFVLFFFFPIKNCFENI